ncbi:tyrosine-type recombinase/integrase [Mesorhizobium sp. PUT5]|uniref:tyrosine-type recombinase/integrase n=1 Tax=Mesorhizobium sp. PUT5 TaxID=3454629 RepID=UPI003FA44845
MTAEHPYASSYKDRHGTERWRFRRNGKTISLPGCPGESDFEAAYRAAIEGRAPPKKASVVAMPGASLPETFGAAWKRVMQSAEWKAYDVATKTKNAKLAEGFLLSRVVPDNPFLWRDVPVKDMRRRHLKDIIATHSSTPHKAKHLLVAIRKMIYAALDEEWIDVDPSYKLKWRPEYVGWKAWTPEAMEAFERRWPVGTTPRLTYALALWLGNRRSDIVTLRWDQRCTRHVQQGETTRNVDGFLVTQEKGGAEVFVPITPMLEDVLEATPRRGETVLVTQYGEPFSAKSITGRMADWTSTAKIGKGHTLHGLRKTLGKMLAEGGASTRQLMKILGHDDIEHAELYSREAEQALLATEGMDKVTKLVRRRRG